MENLTIRTATETDEAKLIELSAELQIHEKSVYPIRKDPQEYANEAWENMLNEMREGTADIFVAELEGEVVGFIFCHAEDNIADIDDTYYVEDLSVSSGHRSLGIGTKLLQYAEQVAKNKGFKLFGLGVLAANERVLEYYKRYGFEVYGIEMNKRI